MRRLFGRISGPIVIERGVELPDLAIEKDERGELTWRSIFDTVMDLRATHAIPTETFAALALGEPNERSWFAASAANFEAERSSRDLFLSAEDFSWITPCPREGLLANFVMRRVLRDLLRRGGEHDEGRHREDTGCLLDFCKEKEALSKSLRTGDICRACLTRLREAGADDELLRQVMRISEEIRRASLDAGIYVAAGVIPFAALPFPVAVTRHRVAVERDGLRRFLALLDHFDCLVRYAVVTGHAVRGEQLGLGDRPTSLGSWVQKLADVTSIEGISEVRALIESEKVVKLRNDTKHGYLPAANEDLVPHTELLARVLPQMEQHFQRLLELRLLFVERAALSEGQWSLSVRRLQGSNTFHEPESISLDRDPREAGMKNDGRVMLQATDDHGGERFLDLHPWIQQRSCPACNHTRLLIIDGVEYLDPLVGHRVKLS